MLNSLSSLETLLSIQELFDKGFLFILLLFFLREIVISLLILSKRKKYLLFGVLFMLPLIWVIKVISHKQFERIMKNYYSRIQVYAIFSLIGAPILIWVVITDLINKYFS
jgi:hypothetical protein